MNQNHFEEDDVALTESQIAIGVLYYDTNTRQITLAPSGLFNHEQYPIERFEMFGLSDAEQLGVLAQRLTKELPENSVAVRVYTATYVATRMGERSHRDRIAREAALTILDIEQPARPKRLPYYEEY